LYWNRDDRAQFAADLVEFTTGLHVVAWREKENHPIILVSNDDVGSKLFTLVRRTEWIASEQRERFLKLFRRPCYAPAKYFHVIFSQPRRGRALMDQPVSRLMFEWSPDELDEKAAVVHSWAKVHIWDAPADIRQAD
jgi:hypothetical protein